MTNTAKIAKLNRRWFDDEELFFRENLCIRHKHGGRIIKWDFESFPAQLKLVRMVRQMRLDRRPVRIIGLKPRQIGLTSGAAGIIYKNTSLQPNVLSQIISNDLESVESILEKMDVFWSFTHESMRPLRGRSNRREMLFINPDRRSRDRDRGLGSRIFIESAKKVTVGRGQTVQNLLGSEVAYWKSGHERALSVMNSIPEVAGTCVIMESTAQGLGFFWDLWQWTKQPGSIWVPFFFGWHEHPEYTREIDEYWHAEDLDEEEIRLVGNLKVTPGQIAWRRYTIANKCNNDIELFHQEYPITAEEAFLTSGRPAFDRARVMAMRKRHEENGTQMVLYRHPQGGLDEISAYASESPLTVFRPPQPGRLYVMGCDVAQGLDKGDFSCIQVVDVIAREQVAEFHGHVTPDELVMYGTMLGWWYHEALFAIENNKDGLYVNAHASSIYPNLYVQERFEQVDRRLTNEYGWHTDDARKRVICHELNNQIKYNRCVFHSFRFFEEALDFERDDKGVFGAPPGRHDDSVMAAAIAMWLAIQENIQVAQIQMMATDDVRIRVPLNMRVSDRRRKEDEDIPSWML